MVPRVVVAFLLLATLPAIEGTQAVHAAQESDLLISVLSNRADLVSGGDALVEIVGRDLDAVRVDVDGGDHSGDFARRPDGRVMGLLTGLSVGRNTVRARRPDGTSAALVVTNHPASGPVFAGPQVQPWVCRTEMFGLGPAHGPDCDAPAQYTFKYKSSANGRFERYDPARPPTDVGTTTTDQGVTVPYIVRLERGVIDRGIYAVAVLYDPRQPWAPWAPQPAWNGKLLYPFNGDCNPNHLQPAPPNGEGVIDDAALSRGFAVATSGLNVLGQNCNDVVAAEAMMMLKEHVVETYGPIRYTIGNGCSGGSMQQHWLAANYPGLLDGIQPSCSYPDIWEAAQEAEDCALLDRAFDRDLSSVVHQDAVNGYLLPSTCRSWDQPVTGGYARTFFDPAHAAGCLGSGNLFGLGDLGAPSPPWVYDPRTNRKGTRCTLQDYQVAIFGRRASDGFANRPFDNVGVQYGLTALQSGLITPERFVTLNERVGGFDIDRNWQPGRSVADAAALEIAYRTGRVVDGRQVAKVPVIDLRGADNLEIHTDHHSYVMRARLQQANGTADNQVIWTGLPPVTGDTFAAADALVLMDRWLSAVEADRRGRPLEEKVVADKPADAVDACGALGRRITDAAVCRTAFPYFANPRIAAGGPFADNVLKCRVKPLRRADYATAFTEIQWIRLRRAFPTGVCDYRRPGVGQRGSIPWMTFAAGPGGRPLGPPPASHTLPA